MPVRLKELKQISQAERENAVIEAVTELGFASILDVTNFVAKKFEIDLTASNTQEAFKKSIRTDLKKLAGRTLGVAYFSKNQDAQIRLSEEDLEYDKKGNVKNIYNIKYFKPGSSSSIPGENLFSNLGGHFFPQYNQAGEATIDWSFRVFNSIKKAHLHLVFKLSSNNYICLNAPLVDLPIKILIARSTGSTNQNLELANMRKELGARSAVIHLPDAKISGSKKDGPLGHVIIDFKKDESSIEVFDLESTNGTYISSIDEKDIKECLALASKIGTAKAPW